MPQTYNDLYLDIRRELVKDGAAQPALEAREIVCFVSARTRDEFFRDKAMYATDEKIAAAYDLLGRRRMGEPLAYLINEWEFMGHTLEISRDVLIPRADTELLAETAIAALPESGHARVLDLCCGSGCIGISVAHARSDVNVLLADISTDVISVARRNIRKNNLSARVASVIADALLPASTALGFFELIVSNPPYIPTVDIQALDTSVCKYEPVLALDGGSDGLDFYRAIVKNFKMLLKRSGAMMFEVGISQAMSVAAILESCGFAEIEILRDLGGIERVVKGVLL